ncbi:unnamed protein product [Oikopleura dioica]|uniref:Uncharacterized protein n=1 Tax=Oikopleura dioica TaxID=34765 RepID=E4WT78_OIKDI|nr:unnamed protein product [Oikopleura dioica]
MMDIRIPPILTEKEIALPRQNSEKRKRVFDESESENENCDFSIFSETLIDHMISSVNIPGDEDLFNLIGDLPSSLDNLPDEVILNLCENPKNDENAELTMNLVEIRETRRKFPLFIFRNDKMERAYLVNKVKRNVETGFSIYLKCDKGLRDKCPATVIIRTLNSDLIKTVKTSTGGEKLKLLDAKELLRPENFFDCIFGRPHSCKVHIMDRRKRKLARQAENGRKSGSISDFSSAETDIDMI